MIFLLKAPCVHFNKLALLQWKMIHFKINEINIFEHINVIYGSLVSNIKVKKIIKSSFFNLGNDISLTNHFFCQKVEN